MQSITKDNNTTHKLYNSDLFDAGITDKINMVLTDLPYGTTNAKWDSVLDLGKFWDYLSPLRTPTTPVLLFAQTPFDKVLGCSNIKELKYEWIWEKGNATGHLNAKKMPMKAHENILCFYEKPPTYNPQKTEGHTLKESKDNLGGSELYGVSKKRNYSSTSRYPRDVLKFASDKQKLNIHSTQKPLELLRYMIRTYTNVGDTVLDATAGSCSVAVAAYLEGRNSICIEKEGNHYNDAVRWVKGCTMEDNYKLEDK